MEMPKRNKETSDPTSNSDELMELEVTDPVEPSIPENTFFDVLDCVEEPYDDIDEYESSDEGAPQTNLSNSDENKHTYKFEFDPEEIYDAIDGNPEDFEECYVTEKPSNIPEADSLPDGWREVYHESGALLYWHSETNVCSLSRPYFLGSGSTKTHKLPETAIPCLNYRNSISDTSEISHSDGTVISYCKQLFKFKKIKYLKFKSWDIRRSYLRTLRNERNRRKCPFSNNKFITFPMVMKDKEGNVTSTKKWIMNPRGKSYVAILHEYLQQSLKTQPMYTFSEVDNARTPYAATVTVNGDEYGTGVGMSKKEAKIEAAKATLLVLLPKMKKLLLNGDEKSREKDNNFEVDELNVATIFDDIEITDLRVALLSKRTTEPTPYELLLKCLQKKNDNQEVKFDFKMESAECTMSVGQHTVTVSCVNKRDGKQQAAQALLQALHPYINNWGSLLRLYSSYSADQYQVGVRQMIEEKEIDEVKNRSPNKTLLTSLRHRMRKLEEAK